MTRNLLICIVLYLILGTLEELYKDVGDEAVTRRHRMIKFALYQDLVVALSVMKMMVVEGYTLGGVVRRVRGAGLVTHVYLATACVLHGALLVDERVDHGARLRPADTDHEHPPPHIDTDQKELLLV